MARRTTIPAKTKKALLNCLTQKQVDWLQEYYEQTTFEPMNMDDLINGSMTFEEVFIANVRWFEDWSSDVVSRIWFRPAED